MRHKHITLKRELGLFETVLCGVGIILGAGIYVLVGRAAGMAGNSLWISFLLAALLSAFTGLSYAELSSMFPKAGAEYVYTRKAFGKFIAFIIGWLIFVGGIIAASTVTLGFAGYFQKLFNVPIITVSLALLLIVSMIIFLGIKQSALFANAFALIEVLGLVIIIFIGLPYLGKINYFEIPSFSGVFEAAALIFFAFIGFEEIARLSEETKSPRRTIPKALLLAIAITTVIYISVAVAAVSVLDWRVLGASQAPLADVASKAGLNGWLLSVIALFATSNTVLLILLASSRIVYGMAASRTLPSVLAEIHPKTRTPWVAIFSLMFFSMLFVFIGDIKIVANLTNFTVFITFIAINASVIFLRYKVKERAFKVPLNIGKFPLLPLFGIIFSLFMLTNIGFDVLIYGAGLLVLGALSFKLLEYRGYLKRVHAKKY